MKTWIKDVYENMRGDMKRAHKSLTLWFNGVVAAVSSALLALPVDQVIAFMPQFQPYLEDALFKNIMLILIAVNGINMMLRFRTNKALRDK